MNFTFGILNFIHEWSDAWVMLTGIGTTALAIATFCVIRQTQYQRRDAERQHRDRFKPICILAPQGGVDVWNKRGKLISTTPPGADNPSCGTVAIHCVLRNVGVGPALKLRLKFHFPHKNCYTTDPWELIPLGTEESLGGKDTPILVPILLQGSFLQTDFGTIEDGLWEIWLEYEDVFGKTFKTVHRNAPLNFGPASFESTTSPQGQELQAIVRSIPWLTFIEGSDRA